MWWGGFIVGFYVGVLFMGAVAGFIGGREAWRDKERKMKGNYREKK